MQKKHFKIALTIMAIALSNPAHPYSLNDYHKHNAGQVSNIKRIDSTYPIKNEHTVSEFGFMRCFQDMSHRYNVKKNLLIAHAIKESHLNPDAVNRQKEGEAVGLMQIHSQWFPRLQKDYHITRDMLLRDPCLNISVGAWIIANNFSAKGVSWDAVGAYYGGYSDSKADDRYWYYGGKGGIREIYRRLEQGEDPILIAKE
ncbi:TPA: lytic transglycosylase domain-containing protein [Aeromonas veronii]|uniref:lytic transglycosylase domain-containing protein n=1 Tax=Aeromonas TaxID=642 RepID=UPI001C2448E0|nr:lytic transglycosylase domain-containing protein [Aeromonas sp. FDAARGOS 1405]QXB31749.1 lytic transglycosylase domain-containing protein [Aeromonas sp. FDAARGOS 1405]QXB31810.1 lytic transglycosylase domain-containing protein [Aeromonas sp. FDAARGOS 1405]HDO1376857.1 lytic transglycosylase domain-containing protein [Aeromonas veronii]